MHDHEVPAFCEGAKRSDSSRLRTRLGGSPVGDGGAWYLDGDTYEWSGLSSADIGMRGRDDE